MNWHKKKNGGKKGRDVWRELFGEKSTVWGKAYWDVKYKI